MVECARLAIIAVVIGSIVTGHRAARERVQAEGHVQADDLRRQQSLGLHRMGHAKWMKMVKRAGRAAPANMWFPANEARGPIDSHAFFLDKE